MFDTIIVAAEESHGNDLGARRRRGRIGVHLGRDVRHRSVHNVGTVVNNIQLKFAMSADDADDAAAAYLVNAMRRLQVRKAILLFTFLAFVTKSSNSVCPKARCAIGLNQALDSQTKR
jgi:hypothetical protein